MPYIMTYGAAAKGLSLKSFVCLSPMKIVLNLLVWLSRKALCSCAIGHYVWHKFIIVFFSAIHLKSFNM